MRKYMPNIATSAWYLFFLFMDYKEQLVLSAMSSVRSAWHRLGTVPLYCPKFCTFFLSVSEGPIAIVCVKQFFSPLHWHRCKWRNWRQHTAAFKPSEEIQIPIHNTNLWSFFPFHFVVCFLLRDRKLELQRNSVSVPFPDKNHVTCTPFKACE